MILNGRHLLQKVLGEIRKNIPGFTTLMDRFSFHFRSILANSFDRELYTDSRIHVWIWNPSIWHTLWVPKKFNKKTEVSLLAISWILPKFRWLETQFVGRTFLFSVRYQVTLKMLGNASWSWSLKKMCRCNLAFFLSCVGWFFWAMKKTLGLLDYIGGEKLPSYIAFFFSAVFLPLPFFLVHPLNGF